MLKLVIELARRHHLKIFKEARDRIVPLQPFFGRMLWSFSVGFRWSVSQLKGRSEERRSAALPPSVSHILRRALGPKERVGASCVIIGAEP